MSERPNKNAPSKSNGIDRLHSLLHGPQADETCDTNFGPLPALCFDAADEINRLRGEMAEIRAIVGAR